LHTAERLGDLIDRVLSYPSWEIIAELVIIGAIVWAIIRFVKGTRAAGALRGIAVIFAVVSFIFIFRLAFGADRFERIGYLFDRFVAIVAVALVVIFQPELRRAAIRVGEARFFRNSPTEIARVVDAIAEACSFLSKAQFGAIIVVERDVGLEHLIEGGTVLRADLSSRLLQSIFYPGSALHDLAVVIRGNVIHSAGVQLPLAEPGDMPDPGFGARHRAAVGLTAECDALVVVVSEETGHIRLAERGQLSTPLGISDLRTELTRRLRKEPPKSGRTAGDLAEESDVLKAKGKDRSES
jgi:diadenylate cyclase